MRIFPEKISRILMLALTNVFVFFVIASWANGMESDFTGEWNRTNVLFAEQATIQITEQTEKSFSFEFDGCCGAYAGGMIAEAFFLEEKKAICHFDGRVYDYETQEYTPEQVVIEFLFSGDRLFVSRTQGAIKAMGFARGVEIDGEYTKASPLYTNADLLEEILPTEELKRNVCLLLGEERYGDLLEILKWGHPIPFKDGSMTYSYAVIGSYSRADLLIYEDNIYCLLDDGSFESFVFYTNDPIWSKKIPPFFDPDSYESLSDLMYGKESDVELTIVYKNLTLPEVPETPAIPEKPARPDIEYDGPLNILEPNLYA
jgi:hypothetical protein